MRNVPETLWYLEMFQVHQKTIKMSKDSELSKTRPIRAESRDGPGFKMCHLLYI